MSLVLSCMGASAGGKHFEDFFKRGKLKISMFSCLNKNPSPKFRNLVNLAGSYFSEISDSAWFYFCTVKCSKFSRRFARRGFIFSETQTRRGFIFLKTQTPKLAGSY